jgi:CHAT domain-containing protein/tetratricopeptide (TPR) repeat protein
MHRLISLVICMSTSTLLCVEVKADDPPKKLTEEERKELNTKTEELFRLASKNYVAGNYGAAEMEFKSVLEIARQLYPKAEYPDGHPTLLRILSLLAGTLDVQQKSTEAESYHRAALKIAKEYYKVANINSAMCLLNLGLCLDRQGRYIDCEECCREALKTYKQVYKENRPDLLPFLNSLTNALRKQEKFSEAEQVASEALAISRELFKNDHLFVMNSLLLLARTYQAQGKIALAEPLLKEALEIGKRRYKGDNHDLAAVMNDLGNLYTDQGKLIEAERFCKDSLEVKRRLIKGDHHDLVAALGNLGVIASELGKYAEAEPLFEESLNMSKRLHNGDHPAVASSLRNLGIAYENQGKYAEAERLSKECLEMRKRLFRDDNLDLASQLCSLGFFYQKRRKNAEAEPLLRAAMEMHRRITSRYASEKAEGETLTLIGSLPRARDIFLSNALSLESKPVAVYAQCWSEKGHIARVYEGRQQRARSSSDIATANMLAELADARRRRAELLLAPATKDPGTLRKRNEDIQNYESLVAKRTIEIKDRLPAIARAERIAAAQPSDLQRALPHNTAVVDFLEYVHFEQDQDKPGLKGQKETRRFLAFVVTRDKIAWVNLDTAERIDAAVEAWREAITGSALKKAPKASAENIARLGSKVREVVWDKVRRELPANITTLYICPDKALCKVPFAALPGDKPGTVLLEDFALASIPHGPFLLDQLWSPLERKSRPVGALAIGGVKYDLELPTTAPEDAKVPGSPLVKPDDKPEWAFLPATVAEANGFATAAERKKLHTTRLEGDKATAAAMLAALPQVSYAHLATHGFFADSFFRSIFQLDPKDYEQSRRGERIGRAANSPLVMTGLVFAGANNPKTSGRGIITGESLIDLDLSGLELAVLSACETGLGDVAGGEGTFGLQRAFHMAGTRNVVASLWKVPDQSTAALMALFYRNLWEKNLSPMESLRQAQLEIYKNPGKIGELAKGFRGKFEEVSGASAEVETKPSKDGTAHPLLWAAFTLSGPG